MISEKMKSHVGAEGVIRKMFEAGLQMKAEFGSENVFDFSLGNPNVPAPQKVQDSIKRIVDTLPPGKIHSYMPNAGFPEVRVEVAKHLNKVHGTLYSEKNVVMTAGAGSALNLIMKSLLDIDDEVVVPRPYFAEYKGYIENYYGKIAEADPRLDGSFLPDMEKIEEAITPHTKAVLINTPNNPTGVVYPEKVITELAELLRRKEKEIGHPIYLISDEPYREIIFDGKKAPYVAKFYPHTLTCYSFSKSLSVPGERIGYVAVNPACEHADDLVPMFGQISRGIGHNCPSSLIMLAMAETVDDTADLTVYEKNMNLLYDTFKELGFTVVRPGGTFYIMPKALEDDAVAFCQKALRYDLVFVPADGFGAPGHFRVAYCIDTEKVERSLERIREFVRKEYPNAGN